MPVSKNRKNHKQQLNKRKNMQNQTVKTPNLPEVRNVPTWDANAKIEMSGYEWETIFNTFANLSYINQVINSVMTRNILNGTVKMDFEKLNPQTLQYEPMPEDEKQKYTEEFNKVIEGIKQVAPPPVQVGQDEATPQVAVDEQPVQQGGKIITMA